MKKTSKSSNEMPQKDGSMRYVFTFNNNTSNSDKNEIIESHKVFIDELLEEFNGELFGDIINVDNSEDEDVIIESYAKTYIPEKSLKEMNSSITLQTMGIGDSNVEVVEFETGHWQQYEKISVVEGTIENNQKNGDREYVDNLNKTMWPVKLI